MKNIRTIANHIQRAKTVWNALHFITIKPAENLEIKKQCKPELPAYKLWIICIAFCVWLFLSKAVIDEHTIWTWSYIAMHSISSKADIIQHLSRLNFCELSHSYYFSLLFKNLNTTVSQNLPHSLAHLLSGTLPQSLPGAEFCLLLSLGSSKISEISHDL